MDDLISRTMAIDALRYAELGCELEAIETLPSAERKKGKWIPQEDEEGYPLGCACSECGKSYVMPDGWAYYCPNCGAEMRGE